MWRAIWRLVVVGVVVGALILLFDQLMVNNPQAAQVVLPGLALQASVGLIVAGAVALGIVLAALLLLPGRWRSAWRRQRLSRYARRLEGELLAVHARHDQVRASGPKPAPATDHAPDRTSPLPAYPRTEPPAPHDAAEREPVTMP